MSLLRRLANAAVDAPTVVPEPVQQGAPSRIGRAAGVRTGNVAPGQMAAIPDNYLSTIINNQDRIPDRSRIGGRDDGYMHVSSLVNACARREVIASLHAVEHFNRVTAAHRLMWDIGRSVEKHIRDQFIAGTDAQGVYGRWECVCGHTHHVGMRPVQTRTCIRCRKPMDVYREEPIYDDENMLVGNADMPFMLGDYLVVTEIKSMNKDDFAKLTGPVGNHITQVGTYRRMYERAGWRVHKKALVIYADKGFKWGSPYKEFQVDCTTTAVRRQVELVEEAGATIKDHRARGTLPPRTVCATPAHKLSKECPVQGHCWSLRG